jgi:hypothetical protein
MNPGLWDLVFGGGGLSGDPNTLYLTAGGGNQPNFPAGGSTTSVFASVIPASAAGSQDFSLTLSAQSAMVTHGSSASVMIGSSAVGGFNGQISLSCTAPSGLTCAFNPTTISPGSSAASSTLTISAAATPPPGGYHSLNGMFLLLPGLGVFGTVLTIRRKQLFKGKNILGTAVLGLVIVISLFAFGCGSSSSNKTATPPSAQLNVMVTGTSGAISHTAAVAITVH